MDYGLGAIVGAGMGLLLEGHNDRRQLEQQRRLQALQIQGQQQMGDYNYAKQLQFWKDTNFQEQMKQLRIAGLNPALLYKQGGSGGATIGSPAGNVQGATAPAGGMEIMNAIATKANIDLIKAQTEKTKAETTAVAPGIEKTQTETAKMNAEIEDIKQHVQSQQTQQALTRAQTILAELEGAFQKDTLENRKSIVNLSLSKLIEEVSIIENDREISDNTKETTILRLKREALQVYLQNELIKGQTKVEHQKIYNMVNEIMSRRRALNIEKFKAELMADKNFRDAQERGDINIDEILDNIGIIIPGIGRGAAKIPEMRGFHKR